MTPLELSAMSNRRLGVWGEDYAKQYLVRSGHKIIAQNWRNSRKGEIDIISLKGNILVFTEVKTRRTVRTGRPIDAIERRKYQQIKSCINAFLAEFEGKYNKMRIDAIGIIATEEKISLKHIKGVRIW